MTINLISYIKSKKSISLVFSFWSLFVIDDDEVKINWVVYTSTISFCKTFYCCYENSIFCQSLIVMSNWLRDVEFVEIDFWLAKLLSIWVIELLVFWLTKLLTTWVVWKIELTNLLIIEFVELLTTKSIKSWLSSTKFSIDEKTIEFDEKKRDLNLIRLETTKKNLDDVSSIEYDFDVIVFARKNIVCELTFNQLR